MAGRVPSVLPDSRRRCRLGRRRLEAGCGSKGVRGRAAAHPELSQAACCPRWVWVGVLVGWTSCSFCL